MAVGGISALATICTIKKLEVANFTKICLECTVHWEEVKAQALWYINVVRQLHHHGSE